MPIPAIIAALVANGLPILANALVGAGKEVVEKKLGVKIPDSTIGLTPEKLTELKAKEMEHEEFLINAGIRKQEMELEAEEKGQAQVTERWRADMTSDSWLSKNIRPLSLAFWTCAILFLILLDSVETLDFNVPQDWIDLIKISYEIILGAYFVGRSVQHVATIVKKGKQDANG